MIVNNRSVHTEGMWWDRFADTSEQAYDLFCEIASAGEKNYVLLDYANKGISIPGTVCEQLYAIEKGWAWK